MAWLILIPVAAAAVALWLLHVRRVLRERSDAVQVAAQQRDKYRRKAERGRRAAEYGAILKRSESIYEQSVARYHQTLQRPLYRMGGALLGYRMLHPEEETKEERKTDDNGGEKTMEKKNNMKQAMFEMFGIGGEEKQADAAEKKEAAPVVAETAPVVEAAPVSAVRPAVEKPHAGSYLAAGTVWEGSLCAEGNVEIAGVFKGSISTKGVATLHSTIDGNVNAGSLTLSGCTLTGDVTVEETVTVSQDSRITGNVTAKELRCAGRIEGDLAVSGAVTLERTAYIKGNIVTDSICVAQGAVICGGVEIKQHTK